MTGEGEDPAGEPDAVPVDIGALPPSFDVDDDRLEALVATYEYLAEETAYYDWLGLSVRDCRPGRVVLRLPFDESLTTPSPPAPPTIHGGVLATLIDLSGIGAVLAAEGELVGITTVDLDVTYHSSVDGAVLADAVCVNAGDTLAAARVTIYPAEEEDPDPVATGETTCRFVGD